MRRARPRSRRPDQAGFTIIEVMIALTILLIGIVGLLSMQLSAMRATAFSRHATEATVLAQDKMEALRTEPTDGLTAGTDLVDAQGLNSADGPYTRTWTPSVIDEGAFVQIDVAWEEQGEIFHIKMNTVRN